MVDTTNIRTESAGYAKGKLCQLNIDDLHPDPEQWYSSPGEQSLVELSALIVSQGMVPPILVRPGADGVFIIVSGVRRYQAARRAGLTSIPAIITDGEPAEISIVENLLRKKLSAIEEAEGIGRLKAQFDYAESDLVAIVSNLIPPFRPGFLSTAHRSK